MQISGMGGGREKAAFLLVLVRLQLEESYSVVFSDILLADEVAREREKADWLSQPSG